MPSLIPSSQLFSESFESTAIRDIFSDTKLVSHYLEIEAALAKAQGKLGIIPTEAADAIHHCANINHIDLQKLANRTAIVGYPILPLIEQLSLLPSNNLGQYCHWGATTQDIMDTADAIQYRASLKLIGNEVRAFTDALVNLIKKHKLTIMPARTHLQQSTPTSLGFMLLCYLETLDQNICEIESLIEECCCIQFGGASGTIASLGNRGLEVRTELAKELGLSEPHVTWHTMRGRFVKISAWLARLCGTLGKIGIDISLLMQTEVGEISEKFTEGYGASSTMPQKHNPIASEHLIAASNITQHLNSLMYSTMRQDHQRASGNWHIEWYAMPQLFMVTHSAIVRAKDVFLNLNIDEQRMLENIEITHGQIMAESVMMKLSQFVGRQVAHDIVYEACNIARKEKCHLQNVLTRNDQIMQHISFDELISLFKPEHYLGSAPVMIEKYLDEREA
ncbi:adenylosuccinate lyase family protein [Planctomycetota bacterium]|nr:adenylosuccinate lyase family protein [Planctomycetota bacterium]